MNDSALHQLKFPIGEFEKPEVIDSNILNEWIEDIASFPQNIFLLTQALSVKEKNWKYRPGGWTIKQVVHHCSDSHMNSLVRFKLALTEDNPTIRPYFEARWAEMPLGQDDNLEPTYNLLGSLHEIWVKLLHSLGPQDLKRTFTNPESGDTVPLAEAIGIYAWHCRHHTAHVQQALIFKGEFQ